MQELQEVQEVQEDTFRENPLIAALFPDSSSDPLEVVGLDGYLGRSSRRGYVRVYEESLRSFLDIPRDRVRYVARRKPIDGLPYATDLIWIEGKVIEGKVMSGDDREPFYSGGELARTTSAVKSANRPDPPDPVAGERDEPGSGRRRGIYTRFG